MAGPIQGTNTYNQNDVARDRLDSSAKLPSAQTPKRREETSTNFRSNAQSVQDMVRNIELPQSLPSVVHDMKYDVATAIGYILPEGKISSLEASAATAARITLTEAMAGSHPQEIAKATLPKIPKVPAKLDGALTRTSLATKAFSATRGGKLFGGLAKGLGRLVGRIAAPLFFAADVMSEADKARGLAKASGGLAASSLGFLGGSALGTGIGTLLMPGVGTIVGYYAGGAIGAAIAYGYGQTIGTSLYDSAKESNPQLVSSMKSGFSSLLTKSSKAFDSSVSGVKKYAPPAIDKASEIMRRTFDVISSRLPNKQAGVSSERLKP